MEGGSEQKNKLIVKSIFFSRVTHQTFNSPPSDNREAVMLQIP